MFVIVASLLCVIIFIMAAYLIYFQQQLRNIRRLLEKRLSEKTRQPISLELMNQELNKLAASINKNLIEEEKKAIAHSREEQNFKELIANISHDLRTPLTVIKGYQQLLLSSELSDAQRKQLDAAQEHARLLEELIERLFEYAYLTTIEQTVSYERINLTNLLMENVAGAIDEFEKKNLYVHIAHGDPVILWSNKEWITRIVQNLLRNCLNHSAGDIEIRLAAQKNEAAISFLNPVNNGADLDADRLFDRFYTADKTRRENAGLGLSIVKLLTEKLNGRANASIQNGLIEVQIVLPLKMYYL